jgi:hypothetical protein
MKRIVILCAIFLLIALPCSSKSLLVVRCKPNSQGLLIFQRLYKYPLKDGRVWKGKKIMSSANVRFSLGGIHIYRNRYIVAMADVVDIKTGKVIHDGMGDFIAFDGDRIIFRENCRKGGREIRGIYAFDLKSKKYEKLSEQVKWNYPGTLSPDGTKSAASPEDAIYAQLQDKKYKLKGDVWASYIYIYDSNGVRRVGNRFGVQLSKLSSYIPRSVFAWIDNNSLISQKGNGNIVKVSIDGTVEPVVQIPIREYPVSLPSFERNPDGSFTYHCCGYYRINLEEKTYKKFKPGDPSTPKILGHRFTAIKTAKKNQYTVQYRGKEIGHAKEVGYRTRTTENAIAIPVYSEDRYSSEIVSIRVWDADSGKWSTFEENDLYQIIGWVEDNPKSQNNRDHSQ